MVPAADFCYFLVQLDAPNSSFEGDKTREPVYVGACGINHRLTAQEVMSRSRDYCSNPAQSDPEKQGVRLSKKAWKIETVTHRKR